MELAMSNQTFISVGPYWDIVHRHWTSFFSTIVAGLTLTVLALFLVPKEYTSSVLLEVWHSDVQQTLIGADTKELERHNAETIKLISSEVDETRDKLADSQRQIKILKEKYRGSLPQDLDDNVRALQALQTQVERTAPAAGKTDALDGTA